MSHDGARTRTTPAMNLQILAVLATVVTARAEIHYNGGLMIKGPLTSCSYSDNYNPPAYNNPLFNQLGSPWLGKYPSAQTFSNVPATLQNGVEVSNPSALCSCGLIHDTEVSAPLVAGATEQLLGARAVTPGVPTQSRFVFPSEYATSPGLPSTTLTSLAPPIPPAPDPLTTINETPTSHIMKIPRRCDSSSFTITYDAPDSQFSSSVSKPNCVYSSLSPPPASFTFPPRSIFYTQPPPLLPSCPATVFYPATIPYSVYRPPFTCPAHYPSQPPNITPSPLQSTQPFLPSTSSLPSTTTNPKTDGKTVASFTTNIPDSKFYNVTTEAEKRDPLLTFKLLTAAAARTPHLSSPPSPSLEAEAASKDCSMPIPPPLIL